MAQEVSQLKVSREMLDNKIVKNIVIDPVRALLEINGVDVYRL